jgi:hypothetical protein
MISNKVSGPKYVGGADATNPAGVAAGAAVDGEAVGPFDQATPAETKASNVGRAAAATADRILIIRQLIILRRKPEKQWVCLNY